MQLRRAPSGPSSTRAITKKLVEDAQKGVRKDVERGVHIPPVHGLVGQQPEMHAEEGYNDALDSLD